MEESLEVELIFEDEEGKTSLTGNLPVCLQGSCTRKERQMKRNIVIQSEANYPQRTSCLIFGVYIK